MRKIKQFISENYIPKENIEDIGIEHQQEMGEAYTRGFIAGADATGSQAEEIMAEKLAEQEASENNPFGTTVEAYDIMIEIEIIKKL